MVVLLLLIMLVCGSITIEQSCEVFSPITHNPGWSPRASFLARAPSPASYAATIQELSLENYSSGLHYYCVKTINYMFKTISFELFY